MNTPVQIETNGTISIVPFIKLHFPVSFVMDYKFHAPPLTSNILRLGEDDFLKFVVSSEWEIDKAIGIIDLYPDSIWTNAISATDLSLYQPMIRAIKESAPKTLVNVQLHKTISVR